MQRSPSVLVAMSGGVDSSVAAALLHEQGYRVLGSHMKLVHLDGVDHGCCGPQAERDAADVADLIGFDFEIADMNAEFERTVLEDFYAEHRAGRTPNPCVRCKDQSYVLHVMGQDQLRRALFPVGWQTKAETRAHAERLGLPVAAKPDSQEVCFVPGADHGAFLEEHAPDLVGEGEVVDPAGRVLARHGGTFRFTIGQRRGLGVSTGRPTYVVDVERATNRVVVGPVELLGRSGLVADRVHWVAGAPPADGPFESEVRIRYRGEGFPSVVAPAGEDRATVEFRTPQRAVAPGQSAVFYRGDEVLGGGRIVEALH